MSHLWCIEAESKDEKEIAEFADCLGKLLHDSLEVGKNYASYTLDELVYDSDPFSDVDWQTEEDQKQGIDTWEDKMTQLSRRFPSVEITCAHRDFYKSEDLLTLTFRNGACERSGTEVDKEQEEKNRMRLQTGIRKLTDLAAQVRQRTGVMEAAGENHCSCLAQTDHCNITDATELLSKLDDILVTLGGAPSLPEEEADKVVLNGEDTAENIQDNETPDSVAHAKETTKPKCNKRKLDVTDSSASSATAKRCRGFKNSGDHSQRQPCAQTRGLKNGYCRFHTDQATTE